MLSWRRRATRLFELLRHLHIDLIVASWLGVDAIPDLVGETSTLGLPFLLLVHWGTPCARVAHAVTPTAAGARARRADEAGRPASRSPPSPAPPPSGRQPRAERHRRRLAA